MTAPYVDSVRAELSTMEAAHILANGLLPENVEAMGKRARTRLNRRD